MTTEITIKMDDGKPGESRAFCCSKLCQKFGMDSNAAQVLNPARRIGWESSMHEYEIRILKLDRGTSLVFASSQRNDDDAIRVARKLAEGKPLEVWRGDGLHLSG